MPESVNVDDLMKSAGIETTTATPAPSPKKEAAEPAKNGAFLAQDGRMLYKYSLPNGQTIITPKPLEQMGEQDYYDLPITLSDNGSNRIPQDLTVKFRDPQWAGHWFNRKAGDGRAISRARARGYVPALREDCEWIAHGLNDQDGGIVDNDLVLFKIHKALLFLQYKEWQDEARKLGGRDRYKNEAEGTVGGRSDKVNYYHTPQATQEYTGLGPVVHLPQVS